MAHHALLGKIPEKQLAFTMAFCTHQFGGVPLLSLRNRCFCEILQHYQYAKEKFTALTEILYIKMILLKFCYFRCTNGRMAGVGRQCGKLKYSKSSCLVWGRVDVFKPKDNRNSCSYKEGVTTGVLCCRKKDRKLGG